MGTSPPAGWREFNLGKSVWTVPGGARWGCAPGRARVLRVSKPVDVTMPVDDLGSIAANVGR